ncbi:sugar O-acyltransferase [Bdellovibrio bacteriovorus]
MKIGIFGTSGFATEVADVCDSLAIQDIVFISSEVSSEGAAKNGIPVVSESKVPDLQKQGYEFAIGIANPQIKEKISAKYTDLKFVNLIHPAASFGRNQRKELDKCKGLVVGAGVRFMSNIKVGDFVCISLNATIGHDSVLESYISIMPGAHISGNVVIKSKAYIGSGAVVLQGNDSQKLILGGSLKVGAGAVVTQSFENEGTVVGVPAAKIK